MLLKCPPFLNNPLLYVITLYFYHYELPSHRRLPNQLPISHLRPGQSTPFFYPQACRLIQYLMRFLSTGIRNRSEGSALKHDHLRRAIKM